jgi:hypothetical protein
MRRQSRLYSANPGHFGDLVVLKLLSTAVGWHEQGEA